MWKHLFLWTAILAGASGCATQMVAFEVKGFEYNVSFNRAYLDVNRIVLEAPPSARTGFKGYHALIDLGKLRWYPASVADKDIPIARGMHFSTSPPPPVPPNSTCIDITPKWLCPPSNETRVTVTLADGTTHRYKLELSRNSVGEISTVYFLRATSADTEEVLYSKVAPQRGGTPLAALLYPVALAVDAVSVPFVVFTSVATGH